jgi:small subunit ribosomal protein S8
VEKRRLSMAFNDPISDMLTRIRNAAKVRKEAVDIPASKLKEQVAAKLLDEGFIENTETIVKGSKKIIRIKLKYDKKKNNLISHLRRISKPGRRVYVSSAKIPRVLRGFGMAIISTSKGIMTDAEARQKKVGGEVLCYIW